MKIKISLIVFSALMLLLATSCSSTNNSSTAANPASINAVCPASQEPHILDKNNDGKVRMGIATPGPRDDGAYYQALVETAQRISAEECFESVIVVDNIKSAEAEATLRNLTQQGVDLIAIGGTDIAQQLSILVAEFQNILWYCNCGSDFEPVPRLIQSRDDSSQISYTAGYATGILLKRSDTQNQVLFLGCCDLPFERESLKAFELGIQAINSNYQVTYVPTGAYPFDFNNISSAVETLTARLGNVDAVYPFLADANEPVVQRANENNILALSAGASDVCGRTDIKYDIAVRFDAGDYLETILREIITGKLTEGGIRKFTVGVDPQVGAKFCSATDQEKLELEMIYSAIANGELDQAFTEIKAQVYGGNT